MRNVSSTGAVRVQNCKLKATELRSKVLSKMKAFVEVFDRLLPNREHQQIRKVSPSRAFTSFVYRVVEKLLNQGGRDVLRLSCQPSCEIRLNRSKPNPVRS